MLVRLLQDDNVAVDLAGDAADAARRFISDEHDLLILTHDEGRVPVAQGARVLLALRQRTAQEGRRHVPVLMLLGAAADETTFTEAMDLGVDDVLTGDMPGPQAVARVRAYLALARGLRGSTPRRESSPWRHELTQRLVHDLRNPLAGLSSNLAYVDDRLSDGGDPEVREALLDCRAAVGRLRRAASMLVDLGRLEEGNLQLRRQPTQVAALVGDLLEQRQHEAGLRELRLSADFAPALTGRVDQEITGRLLHALLDHALRYATTGSTVQLALAPRGSDGLTVTLRAEGEWLPRVERTALGQAQLGAAAGPVTPGARALPSVAEVGLGLHYAQLAALAHGGSLDIRDDPPPPAAPQRTTVTVQL